MLPNRENVLRVLARLEQAGALPQDGSTSVFISARAGLVRTHATQVAVRVDIARFKSQFLDRITALASH